MSVRANKKERIYRWEKVFEFHGDSWETELSGIGYRSSETLPGKWESGSEMQALAMWYKRYNNKYIRESGCGFCYWRLTKPGSYY